MVTATLPFRSFYLAAAILVFFLSVTAAFVGFFALLAHAVRIHSAACTIKRPLALIPLEHLLAPINSAFFAIPVKAASVG